MEEVSWVQQRAAWSHTACFQRLETDSEGDPSGLLVPELERPFSGPYHPLPTPSHFMGELWTQSLLLWDRWDPRWPECPSWLFSLQEQSCASGQNSGWWTRSSSWRPKSCWRSSVRATGSWCAARCSQCLGPQRHPRPAQHWVGASLSWAASSNSWMNSTRSPQPVTWKARAVHGAMGAN